MAGSDDCRTDCWVAGGLAASRGKLRFARVNNGLWGAFRAKPIYSLVKRASGSRAPVSMAGPDTFAWLALGRWTKFVNL